MTSTPHRTPKRTPNRGHSCEHCQSRERSLFCELKEQQLDFIDQSKFQSRYKPGQYLFYAGNPATGLFCVTSGTIKLESTDPSGKSHLIQIFSAGSIIGYRALFSGEPYQSSAIVNEEAEVCYIPKATILELIQKDPPLALNFLMQLSKDFRLMEQRLQRVSSYSAAERIAEALLFLRENFHEKNWTRKEIAEWASTTPETVIRTLAEFEAEGLILQKGRSIQILNRNRILERARISF
jgi:CRP-like cAMP-binding protein